MAEMGVKISPSDLVNQASLAGMNIAISPKDRGSNLSRTFHEVNINKLCKQTNLYNISRFF